MLISQLDTEKLKNEICNFDVPVSDWAAEIADKMLFRHFKDNGEYGDIVLVFGSPFCCENRAPKGAELMGQNRADLILVSGGQKLPQRDMTECEGMREVLLKNNVPNEKILLENKSMFTHENVIYSSEIIAGIFGSEPVRILAVSSHYHIRRVMLNFEHYRGLFSQGAEFIPVPCQSSVNCKTWTEHKHARERVARECISLVEYTRAGYLKFPFEL